MIRFRKVRLDDLALIHSYTIYGRQQNCDLSVANIIGWRFLYNTQIAIVDDFLLFRFFTDGHLAYMAPVPKPENVNANDYEEHAEKIVRALIDDAVAMGHPFLMMGVGEDYRHLIEKRFSGELKIKSERDYYDYIYDRERLETLSGKHLQSKRNHCNRFRALFPNYEYRNLTIDLIPECIRLERIWRQTKTDGQKESVDLDRELRAMTRIFRRWEQLEMQGGCIYVGERMVAFTFGNAVNSDTFDVCVEKADAGYDGAFAMINQQFIRHLPKQFIYINREEDLGDEGLRQAKQSYRPVCLLEKFSVTDTSPLSHFLPPEEEARQTKELWKEVFTQDSPEFIDLYFSLVFHEDYNITCQQDGLVTGALQLLPHKLLYHGEELPLVYVSGVSVRPDRRKENIGDALLHQAHINAYERGQALATLIPAEPWLRQWYGRMGYISHILVTAPPRGIRGMSFDDYDRWQRGKEITVLHDADYYSAAKADIALAGDSYNPPDRVWRGMLRIINAEKVLEAFAHIHPDITLRLQIRADAEIAYNNAYYIIRDGHCRRTDCPEPFCTKVSIAELAELCLGDEWPTMTLMMN